MERYSDRKKRGCPTCDGVDAKTCMRCQGKARMCDWFLTDTGYAHVNQMSRGDLDTLLRIWC